MIPARLLTAAISARALYGPDIGSAQTPDYSTEHRSLIGIERKSCSRWRISEPGSCQSPRFPLKLAHPRVSAAAFPLGGIDAFPVSFYVATLLVSIALCVHAGTSSAFAAVIGSGATGVRRLASPSVSRS